VKLKQEGDQAVIHGRRGRRSNRKLLCGPPLFIEASRAILMGLGVEPQHIMQESFGTPVPKNAHVERVAQEKGVVVEFGRSGKACRVRTDRHCWRRPKSTEWVSLRPANRDSVPLMQGGRRMRRRARTVLCRERPAMIVAIATPRQLWPRSSIVVLNGNGCRNAFP